MSERRLIDATALCRYLSNWQLSCAGNVTGGKDARDNLIIYNTLDKVMEVIKNAPAEEQRVYNVRVDKDKLDAMQKVFTQQVHLIAMETSKPRMVTEMCPNCDREVTMEWDVSVDGYKATCPHCGGRLMLCDTNADTQTVDFATNATLMQKRTPASTTREGKEHEGLNSLRGIAGSVQGVPAFWTRSILLRCTGAVWRPPGMAHPWRRCTGSAGGGK